MPALKSLKMPHLTSCLDTILRESSNMSVIISPFTRWQHGHSIDMDCHVLRYFYYLWSHYVKPWFVAGFRCNPLLFFLCISSAGFESYLAADAINKSVSAVNQSITATTENPSATENVKVLVETIQKVRFSAFLL